MKRGDLVLYSPYPDCPKDLKERGRVKSVSDDGQHVFVLYDTAAQSYTEEDLDQYVAARTAIEDLELV